MKDLFGNALLDYISGNYTEDIFTETNISEIDELSLPYLFRDYKDMPVIEQKALQMAYGNVLDVGCGAGSHALYLQNEKKLHVTAIDLSKGAIETCKQRGLQNAQLTNIMNLNNKTFDTILLLMNGAGMCGQLKKLPSFLQHLKTLLTPNGQILLDSSDIIYMFDEDDNGTKIIPDYGNYYGELEFTIYYKNQKEKPFNWLYIDFNTLHNIATNNGLRCELILEGNHFDYLAKLSVV